MGTELLVPLDGRPPARRVVGRIWVLVGKGQAAQSGMACRLAFLEERMLALAHLGERRGVLQALC